MRIVQVSAHYPPDFVSGGTLMPKRCAQSMKERGHDSYVFAGDINSLEPLDEKDTIEEDIPVHWIGISSYLSWADRKNFDNPPVAEAFKAYLERIRPDIVHFHALQTLGGELLDVARDAGAHVVVTMHDFWWMCSRQFMVNQEFQPCSIVRSCGECECAVSSEWVDERNAWLAQRLRHADLILVPSASMGRAVIANGVPSSLVRVNENGVDTSAVKTRPPHTGATRFLYAGGSDRLKGAEVLKEAVQGAEVVPGTRLSMYGVETGGLPNWVDAYPAFEHEELGGILAEHDVLIVPSLAKESHSILTREALTAGLAVITTDTPGPAEAVATGVNGRIVEPGSVTGLRAAIEELSDPQQAMSLLGQGSMSPVVSPEEHMTELEGYYRALVDDKDPGIGAVGDALQQLIRDVVYIIGIQGAPARYRAHLPAEALATRGITTSIYNYRDPALPERVLLADAVVFYRVPATDQVLDLITSIRQAERTIPILGDVDDLIFDPEIEPLLDNLASLSTEERDLWREGIHRYRTTLENCDYFLGSTQTVSEQAERLIGIPAHTYHNGVSALLAQVSEREMLRERSEGPFRIGFFSGTKTHDADWAYIEPAIAKVLGQRPEVELWLGGLVVPTEVLDPFRDRIVRLPLVPWYDLPAYLRDVDVSLAPLTPNSIFNEAKSAIKWLEAALVGTPTVASPTQPFREVIRNGETGYVADNLDEWETLILHLIDNPALASTIGSRARTDVLLSRSPAIQGEAMETIMTKAWIHVGKHGHRTGSTFRPVTRDEPYTALATDVEPYALPGSKERVRINRATNVARKVRHSLQEDGLKHTAQRILSRVRNKLS